MSGGQRISDMDQEQRRVFLIRELLKEEPRYSRVSVPEDAKAQKDLLRSLMNVRPPRAAGEDFIAVQDEYLKAAIAEKGVTRLEELKSEYGELYLWQGDITTLACGAIVNAANSGMTGCYRPLHSCIDNCIHTFSGVQLRLKCAELIEAQGHEEPTGRAKITPAYNLPFTSPYMSRASHFTQSSSSTNTGIMISFILFSPPAGSCSACCRSGPVS